MVEHVIPKSVTNGLTNDSVVLLCRFTGILLSIIFASSIEKNDNLLFEDNVKARCGTSVITCLHLCTVTDIKVHYPMLSQTINIKFTRRHKKSSNLASVAKVPLQLTTFSPQSSILFPLM